MCARLLACPLCSQPGFLTLDALRAGLVSVATRPLACPVCNEVLLGIEKLTIHLFSHAISNPSASETAAKLIEVRNAQAVQSWNVLNATATQQIETGGVTGTNKRPAEDATTTATATSGIYIPIDEIENFRNLTTIKDHAGGVIPVANGQTIGNDLKAPGQVIFLQNVGTSQSKIYSANVVNQTDSHDQLTSGIYQTVAATTNGEENGNCVAQDNNNNNGSNSNNNGEPIQANVVITVNGLVDGKESFNQNTSWSEHNGNPESAGTAPSHTDRLADLVKNAQITASPLGTFHEAFDCSKPESPPQTSQQPPRNSDESSNGSSSNNNLPRLRSTRILSAAERTERCNVCGFTFPDRNILVMHKQLVHMIQEKDSNVAPEEIMKNYPCHLCTKVFKMRGSLMVHMRVAHPGINAGMNRESSRQNEQGTDQESEGPDIEGGYNCPTCGKNFKKEQLVIQHLKIHEGKQYECDVCSKMFTTKYFLKKHKRLHSGEMPYKCAICDKTFTFQQSFHKHRLYHKDDKPHACTTCGRSFKELSTLHNHERIHTGEKPFACETCGKCFRQRVSYLVHRRIHTGVMPYKCTACGKNFRYKVSQRTHKCTQQPPGVVVQQSGAFSQSALTNSDKSEAMDTPEDTNETNHRYKMETRQETKRKLQAESGGGGDRSGLVSKSGVANDRDKEDNDTNDTDDFIQSIWSQDSTNAMDYKESSAKADEIVSNAIKESNLWNETSDSAENSRNMLEESISRHFGSVEATTKELDNEFTSSMWNSNNDVASANEVNCDKLADKSQSTNHANDLLSMVMCPLENEVPSPSTEMEHLRLSSPVNNQENNNSTSDIISDCFPALENGSPSAVQVNDVEPNFVDNENGDGSNSLSTLQTINEDSLKELLYSIVDK